MGRAFASALVLTFLAPQVGCQRSEEERATIRPAAAAPSESSESSAPPKAVTSEAAAGQPLAKDPEPAAQAPAPPSALPDPAARRLRSEQKGFVVVAREGCGEGAPYDLVVHFHGVADAVERQWNGARLGGVLAVANAGTWGRDYKAVYEHKGAYAALLRRVEAQLAEICPNRPVPSGRVALSGWSAGYAAIRAMLRDVGSDPIDAVLLSDGIHASLVSGPQGPRGVAPEDVAPFVEFGKRALEDEKLFSITHSSIHTPDYASTTETTDYLLGALRLERAPTTSGPSLSEKLDVRLLSETAKGGFRVRAYTGESGPEHGWHLHALEETLYRDLRAWWSRPNR